MTRSTNMEHVWKVGDRVRALCGVGDYIRSGDVGTVAAIDCGGCLWCTWDNPVTPELDEFGWCIRADEVAPADAAIAALSAPKSGDWVLVPRVPTPEMAQASNEISCRAEGEEHWAAMLAAAPQPPAEAMEAWHSAMNDVGELRANAPDERYAKRAARVESWIKANRPEPPSAPVGVEDVEAALQKWLDWCNEHNEEPEAKSGARIAIEALAKQPAAAGEEIMVNAAHDVYTLPLKPSGLTSGPRFVVHVPAPEQPAAPSGEASVIIDNYRRSATQHQEPTT